VEKYITYREENEDGTIGYFILQKAFPHYQCIISETPRRKLVEAFPILNYNLYIVFAGTIMGNYFPSYTGVAKDIQEVMSDMAEWFLVKRILQNEKKYKKWRVGNVPVNAK
jgi:hypothetical protein